MAGTAYKLVFLVVGLLGAVLLLFQALYINDATTPSSRHSSGSVRGCAAVWVLRTRFDVLIVLVFVCA